MNVGGKQVANDNDRESDSEDESMISNQKERRLKRLRCRWLGVDRLAQTVNIQKRLKHQGREIEATGWGTPCESEILR